MKNIVLLRLLMTSTVFAMELPVQGPDTTLNKICSELLPIKAELKQKYGLEKYAALEKEVRFVYGTTFMVHSDSVSYGFVYVGNELIELTYKQFQAVLSPDMVELGETALESLPKRRIPYVSASERRRKFKAEAYRKFLEKRKDNESN